MSESLIRRIVVVRHSERIDEVDKDSWNLVVERYQGSRNKADFRKDPCISDNGLLLASEMAVTAKKWLTTNDWSVNRIYCSKLRRCIETAVQLAKELALPIYLSYGLSLTSKSVEERNGGFEFTSTDDLKLLYPDIEFVDCDGSHATDGSDDVFVPRSHWLEPLVFLAERHENCIIVAHSETIKNLSGPTKVPYCSLAKFTYNRKPISSMTDDDGGHDDGDCCDNSSSGLTTDWSFLRKRFEYKLTLARNGDILLDTDRLSVV